ncbi:TetR/AcrR family transcriptional regulator [Chryseobacterium carnipullorum]|uniref:TetR/AcrR family transcriptional regulator n=1 Tax=Chryseobacterium carnipullorum TaxID=1124835 RepID=A0A1M7EYB4_CHRCU|nr:TetR/AcrR family transcriptional regulator [Chryseobacterium carnipullorum]MDN5480162.1 TetR/AcrR family transcriptional regulator [Chryseobacterium sp.]AZA49810.1 TetR/AcrR family transcriptional regulator [Chryseobacterium carnipullorum]AZA64700.1 TetR/AcrR family transcriptional regulator [Chryseobacterium carnipullorum]SHL96730.1 transcriptional regulator, TetR family [Chryseobacterium carnipullorum]STC95834.1 transcriptional regulator BetI [Chryseobacterium carnipullorum]
MERKSAAGSIRNKERSKKKFLDAVGKILKTKGYAGLKVNDIATTAGVDKKMIYTYFGGINGLMDEYIRSKDYWSNVTTEKMAPDLETGGRLFTEAMLLEQFDYIFKNREVQKLLLWRLSESRKSLTKMTNMQEENGESLFKFIIEPHFGERTQDFRAITAIIISGLYYLNMYSSVNGSIFCGIDLSTEDGREKIKKAVSFLIDQTYENL